MANLEDIHLIQLAKQNSLDIQYFLEAIEKDHTLQVISGSKERRAYHFRATKPTGSFGFMIFKENIFLPLNSRITMLVTANKYTTYKWLSSYQIPTPLTYIVQKEYHQVLDLLDKNGVIVLKTTTGQGGNGVKMGVQSLKEIQQFVQAHPSASVIAQTVVKGNDYRLVFLDGELIAAVQRFPAYVVGDGISTVEELAKVADDGFEKTGRGRVLQEKVVKECAKELLLYVPKKGERQEITAKANFSLGGSATEVTSQVAPLTIQLIKPLLHDLGARLVGVDIISEDITMPLTETGAVIELNATPGMLPIAFAENHKDLPHKHIYETIINSIDLS